MIATRKRDALPVSLLYINKAFTERQVNMENEIWKGVEGFDGVFEVSNLGRFRRRGKRITYIKPRVVYERIKIGFSYMGRNEYFDFDVIVANAFLDNPNNRDHVIHKDGDLENNRVDNLMWSEKTDKEIRQLTNSRCRNGGKNDYYVKDGIAYVKMRNTDNIMLCDAEDWEKQKNYTWSENRGYAQTGKFGHTVRFSRVVMDAPEGKEVDHINRNRLDNRKTNLRIVSHRGNMSNVGCQKKSKTKIAGVYWHKHRHKYFAELKVDGKRFCLGAYETLEEAREARKRAEEKYRKPFLEKEALQSGCFFNK